ncbi:MAG: 16S rRNA (uracil(1498)-N(3))-methyltransferase [Acidimicrobiia bacterium]|nr:16S rRNA (uracil(1498)-N(3))-methyltransferase [Acidimicrobiia bacterium]MDH5293440.1 16S rRNA (uracil(1498)-N(3))-methyltransferase [Acidimicrobiia bacterium]
MAHIPHLLIPPPWEGGVLDLSDDQRHHLERVLRMNVGDPCTYTDGEGVIGSGRISETGVERGEERSVPRGRFVTLAVAPPDSRDRVRFLVEKVAELGVARVCWLRTRFSQARPPRVERARSWAQMALEQSRGAYLTQISEGWADWNDLAGALVVADVGGSDRVVVDGPVVVAVGPEGGWEPGEIPDGASRLGLGSRVLRTETAAIVAVFMLLNIGS